MVNLYTVPAITALVAKGVLLYFSRRAKIQNFNTRLFSITVLISIGLSIAEAAGLLYGFDSEYRNLFGRAYAAFAIPLLAAVVHLTALVTFSNPRRYVIFLLYGYTGLLEVLSLFTPLVFERFDQFKGYTITAVGGPLYGLWEAFIICGGLSMIFLPFLGLTQDRPVQVRNQCKLWIAAATPAAALIVTSVILLHLKFRLFNSTVTLPLLVTLLLIAIGYVIHSRRIIELDFYIPWSRTRKEKKRLYEHLSRLYVELTESSSLQEVINRLFEILKCPAALFSSINTAFLKAGPSQSIEKFPKHELCGVDQMLVINEIEEAHPRLHALMKAHQVAVIVPFFPKSKHMASWLLLGDAFCRHVYTPLDFKVIERLFEKLGALLLDELTATNDPMHSGDHAKAHQGKLHEQVKAKLAALLEKFSGEGEEFLDKPLEEHLSEVEALLLKQAIEYCGGNRSKAARFLGMRPNTLHYKLGRYGLLHDKRKQTV